MTQFVKVRHKSFLDKEAVFVLTKKLSVLSSESLLFQKPNSLNLSSFSAQELKNYKRLIKRKVNHEDWIIHIRTIPALTSMKLYIPMEDVGLVWYTNLVFAVFRPNDYFSAPLL